MAELKILTICGTRPEFIRLSIIIKKLDEICEQVLVHTGQHYDYNMSGVFLKELQIREPNYNLGAKGSFVEQASAIFKGIEQVILKEKPNRFLVLGDTNSSLGAIMAKKMNVPIYHMEAGNRAYDERVPEEFNRRLIDHSSDVLLPYTQNAKQNLLKEGFPTNRIYVIGNPVTEVYKYWESEIGKSKVIETMGLLPKHYFLVTVHRHENVSNPERLDKIMEGLNRISEEYGLPVIVSTHRIKERLPTANKEIQFMPPFGFLDFSNLQKNCLCMLSDSGTALEETTIFHIPSITLRDVTERLEVIECGAGTVSGVEPDSIVRCVDKALSSPLDWKCPPEYMEENVSTKVIKILMSYYDNE